MKNILRYLVLLLLIIIDTKAQSQDINVFNSVFQNIVYGSYKGTVSGILIIKRENNSKTILDFQGSDADLEIIKDEDSVYDVSAKHYKGYTTSKKTEIYYETYASANGIGIKLENTEYELTRIDGACDTVIKGIKYSYYTEKETEYLVISVDKELSLNNYHYLLRTETNRNDEVLRGKSKTIKILPQSTLIFAIKRN
jgi:hypothetical protein